MTENQNIYCKYCKEEIKKSARVCFHCGHNQNWYWQWFYQPLPILVSIVIAIIGYWQYNEAKKEREEAKRALEHAQTAEKKITDASKAIAKALLALSSLEDNIDSFGVLKFFPEIMQNEAKSLLDTIEISPEERKKICESRNLLKKWQQTTEPMKKDEIEKEIEQLINK